ncbi:MAG: zinc ribbon domain-containing protein [Anaerolineales bacterium]|nr:zinc ribbon domain-containing protein [Anaerolineales bacterium]
MTKETVGYVELEWTCPTCGSKNSGFDRLCKGCGAAQPDDVKFEQPAQEVLLTDQADIERVKAGPDVHCKYCGARNVATAVACRQCGADLAEGAARESGQVVGAHRDKPAEPVKCPACGTPNDPAAHNCSACGASLAQKISPPPRPAPVAKEKNKGCSPILIGLAVLAVIAVVIIIVLSGKTEAMVGRVEGVEWTLSIGVEALQPVSHKDWFEDIPGDAALGACQMEYHHTESEPVANATKVCGTPYTVDTGGGGGEVVQDCEFQVYAERCEYTVDEWQPVEELTASGADLAPEWPELVLYEGEREGEYKETYKVFLAAEKDTYTYTTTDVDEFLQFVPGSKWNLEVNTFNQLRSVSPAD